MNKKVLFYNGRFYNHENDSIKLRIAHAVRMFLKSLLRAMLSHGRRKRLTNVDLEFQQQFLSCEAVTKFNDKTNDFAITWIGHSTFLIHIFGVNILTDPVFGNVSRFFPRLTSAGISIDQLPKIDFILISHNHRDHMDLPSLKAFEKRDKPTFLVPFGDEKLLKKNGFSNIFQKQWWESQNFCSQNIKFTFLPSVHWSFRGLFDINKSMWGSWMIQMNGIKIYFAGDSAAGGHFEEIGKNFPNIDVALMPIGPCEPRSLMAESHLDPQEAIEAFLDLDAKCFVPMHWGTFKSGFEGLLYPLKNLQEIWAAEQLDEEGRVLSILKFGQTSVLCKKC
jgi:L-ascorbate metabolism protein UlaG (beta-lactamase superfamily)